MSKPDALVFAICMAIILLVFVFKYAKTSSPDKKVNAKILARSGVFAAISIILYVVPFFNLSLPIFPDFLKLHFDEIPVFIAGFAYGPVSAIFILIVKTLVKLPMTITFGIGEFVDFFYSLIFILPATLIYKKRKNIKSALVGFAIGTLFQIVFSCIVTTFVVLNVYTSIVGMSKEFLLSACQSINKNITSLTWPFMLFAVLPFNALKDVIVVIVTMILYKRLHRVIDKIEAQKN